MTPDEFDHASWRSEANCRGVDPDLFFPEPGQGDKVRKAKAICRACVCRRDCLQYALTNGEQAGIWAGTTSRQRRAMPGFKGLRLA